MNLTDKKDIWFAVLNIYAASKRASKYWQKAERRLKELGVVYHGNRTGRSGNAMEITFDACVAGYRKFVAVGGDGTVHDVLNGIASYVDWAEESGKSVRLSDFTLGVIPVGSGNDWIKSTGVPKDVNKAAEVLSNGKIGVQDVVRTSFTDDSGNEISRTYMANVGWVGKEARVCERVNHQKLQGKRGKILYVTSLIYALKHRKTSKARVICDGDVVFEGEFFSMALGVGKYSGGGMRQTPLAVLDDGLLDVTVIPNLPLRRIAREVFRLFTGTFHKVPELVINKCRQVVICPYDTEEFEPVEVDGEVVGKGKVTFQVLEDKINIAQPSAL